MKKFPYYIQHDVMDCDNLNCFKAYAYDICMSYFIGSGQSVSFFSFVFLSVSRSVNHKFLLSL